MSTFTFTTLVPTPKMMITAADTQIVGESLELTCRGSIDRGVTSEVDIIWISDGSELNRTNGIDLTLFENSTSLMYMNTYTIAELSTSDNYKIYYCELVINSPSPVVTNSSILLNVTSKLGMFYSHKSMHNVFHY